MLGENTGLKIREDKMKALKNLYLTAIIVLFMSTVLLCACNKNDNYNIKNFYGDYSTINDYGDFYKVLFNPVTSDRDKYELQYIGWNITSVEYDSFNYFESYNDFQNIKKQECDVFLLKAVSRLMLLFGEEMNLSKTKIYLKDTDVSIEYNQNITKVLKDQNQIRIYDKNKVQVGSAEYLDAAQNTKVLLVSMYDDYVIDEKGILWEIIVSKGYKKID